MLHVLNVEKKFMQQGQQEHWLFICVHVTQQQAQTNSLSVRKMVARERSI